MLVSDNARRQQTITMSISTLIASDDVDNGTPGRANTWGYHVSSLTMTIDDVDDCW